MTEEKKEARSFNKWVLDTVRGTDAYQISKMFMNNTKNKEQKK